MSILVLRPHIAQNLLFSHSLYQKKTYWIELQYQFYIYNGKNCKFQNQKSREIPKRKNKKSTLIIVFTVFEKFVKAEKVKINAADFNILFKGF